MATSARSGSRSPPGRDTRTQLFVGNLPYRVRWQDLKDLFRKAGTVLRADVSLGPDNRSRGYGTVLLATAEDAGRAIDMFNGFSWQTRTLEVRPDRLPPDFSDPTLPNPGMNANPNVNSFHSFNRIHHPKPHHPHASMPFQQSQYLSTQLPQGPPSQILSPSQLPAQLQAQAQGQGPIVGSVPGPGMMYQQDVVDGLGGGVDFVVGSGPGPSFSRKGSAAGLVVGSGTASVGPGAEGGGNGGGRVGSGQALGMTAGKNLFVGNLPFHCQWQDLKDLFRSAGQIVRADVAIGPDGRSRGYGTVLFATEADAMNAVAMFNGYEYNGRRLKVHHDKFKQFQGSGPTSPQHHPSMPPQPALPYLPPLSHPKSPIPKSSVPSHLSQHQQHPQHPPTHITLPMQPQMQYTYAAFTSQPGSPYDPFPPHMAHQQQFSPQHPQHQTLPSISHTHSRSLSIVPPGSPKPNQASGTPSNTGAAGKANGSGVGNSSGTNGSNGNGNGGGSGAQNGRSPPGTIQMPPSHPFTHGGGVPLSPLITRGLPPMTPSMPGFTFHPQMSTPPLAPHFLSPGLGPFSPGPPLTSPTFYHPFLNPAPGAPIHIQPGTPIYAMPPQSPYGPPYRPPVPGSEHGGHDAGGYFPPVYPGVPAEPTEYFPPVPPPAAEESKKLQMSFFTESAAEDYGNDSDSDNSLSIRAERLGIRKVEPPEKVIDLKEPRIQRAKSTTPSGSANESVSGASVTADRGGSNGSRSSNGSVHGGGAANHSNPVAPVFPSISFLSSLAPPEDGGLIGSANGGRRASWNDVDGARRATLGLGHSNSGASSTSVNVGRK